MKLVCDGLDLSDAVLKVIKGTSAKTVNPILEGIKLSAENDGLTLSATDLELSIIKTIRSEVFIDGQIVVPGKFFAEFIKKLSKDQIELSLDDARKLNIKYTDSVTNVSCLNPADFPAIKNIENAEFFEIKGGDFKSIINRTIFSVASDDSRPILKGALLEVQDGFAKIVALDGFRLALCKKPIVGSKTNFKVIVPARSLAEISKLIENDDDVLKVYIANNHLMVDINSCKIITRLLDGDFINYNQIIPTEYTSVVTVNKEQLDNALDRASLLSRIDRNNMVKFDLKDKSMELFSKSDLGDIKENLTIALEGNDLTIAFNARYFSEALRVIGDDFVKLNFKTVAVPCIITPTEGDEFIYLILPVRMI